MRRLLRNWQLKVLALFLAATTWSVVAYAGNPPSVQAFKGITIEHGQAPTRLVLLREPAPVSISVRGLQSSLANFHRENVHAFVDMTGARSGPNLLPVHVRVDSPDRSVTLSAVDPSSVDVELDTLNSIQKPVEIQVSGTPNNCCVLGAKVATPDTVTLKGPAKQLETAIAVVVVDISGRGTAVSNSPTVQPETPDHRPLPQVSASPAQVAVTVGITAVTLTKPAGIDAVPTGQPGAGFHIFDVQVTPTVVEVEADPGILAGVRTIPTDPISIAGATSDVVATVSLHPPTGVTVLTKGPFTVHFVIRPNPVVPTPSASP